MGAAEKSNRNKLYIPMSSMFQTDVMLMNIFFSINYLKSRSLMSFYLKIIATLALIDEWLRRNGSLTPNNTMWEMRHKEIRTQRHDSVGDDWGFFSTLYLFPSPWIILNWFSLNSSTHLCTIYFYIKNRNEIKFLNDLFGLFFSPNMF